jgi:hypothetical protein
LGLRQRDPQTNGQDVGEERMTSDVGGVWQTHDDRRRRWHARAVGEHLGGGFNGQRGALLHGHGAAFGGEGDSVHHAIGGRQGFLTAIRPEGLSRSERDHRSNLAPNRSLKVRDPIHLRRPFEQSDRRLAGLPDY